MTFLVYCGDKTCTFNNCGKCRHFKVALNEQGNCMGYSPLVMPHISSNVGFNQDGVIDEENKNHIGFGG